MVTGNYEIFLHTFTFVVVVDAALGFVCTHHPDKHGSWAGRGCMIAYAVLLTSGKLFWEIERIFCVPGTGGPMSFLHVLWHMLSGVACYFGILADSHNRYANLGVGAA